jgi:RNA polymerase sigma-70 factor (ECF subfamily)
LVREEICGEAIRLAGLLAAHPAGDRPPTHALLALMLLHGARLAARLDGEGNLLLIRDQDRTRWDGAMIARGMYHLSRSASGPEAGEYHFQAGIAACHAAAGDEASTDWRGIVSLYDSLAAIDGSPIVALNRAVAIAHLHGPAAGLDAVAAIRNPEKLDGYHLFHAVRGELEARMGRPQAAAAHLRRALELAEVESERRFLERRLRDCLSDDAAPERDGQGP